MTTRERTALQKLFNEVETCSAESEQMLHELQDLNVAHGDGARWCSWKACLDGVIRENPEDSKERGRAEYLYERHLKAEGRYDALMALGKTLSELGFWKH